MLRIIAPTPLQYYFVFFKLKIPNFCSIVGHEVIHGFAMYGASKHAVTALTEALRKELEERKSKIRVTVSTEITDVPPVKRQVECPV
jgi:NAD(P)-dependent dehydrogenase (short-subunit alcohol dehydrogenase family)